jgi:hypothetical protein
MQLLLRTVSSNRLIFLHLFYSQKSLCLYVCLSIYLSICLSVYLSIYLSVCLCVCVCVCVCVHALSIGIQYIISGSKQSNKESIFYYCLFLAQVSS